MSCPTRFCRSRDPVFSEASSGIPAKSPSPQLYGTSYGLASSACSPPTAEMTWRTIAAVNNLTLVTFNVRDFNRFEGLRVESW